MESAPVPAFRPLYSSPEEQTRADRKREKRHEKTSEPSAFDRFCRDSKAALRENEGIFGIPFF